jgi:hypothetical protein
MAPTHDADSDSDGLDDGDEVNTNFTDPNDTDSDSDGLNDGDEVNTYFTDPNDADSDNDGFGDGDEVVAGSDPLDPLSMPNNAPVATANSVTGIENTTFTFAGSDFTFTDLESDALTQVEITTLPAAGTLKLSGTPVAALDHIAAAGIGNLTFDPAADANGSPYTSFTFKVEAGAGSWSTAAATLTIDVTPTYNLTWTAGAQGSITAPATSPTTHNSGAVVTITAVADPTYHFVNWTGDIGTVANPGLAGTTITMNGDYTIQANFAIDTFTLTYNHDAHGSISGTSPQTVAYGASGSAVTAVPNTGYHFVRWSDLSTANPRTDTSVTANINVTASFAITLAPTVVTEGVASIAATTATGEGNVTDDGGSVITQRGIVWNTGGSPTTADSKASAPGTTGAYTASITGLTAGTLYHVRAYAVNALGTSYGGELTFTTPALVPTAVATATGAGSASFSTNGGAIEELTAVAEVALPTAGKPNLSFPCGFFSFKITGLTPGQTVVVTITLPETVPIGTQYWKYHASKGGWIEIPMGDDDGDNVITITLVDGGPGDDGGKDGTILDPGGPGEPPVPVPGVSQWGILALAVLLGGAMVWVIRQKQILRGTH